jgi:hypothetical protein
VQRKPIVLAVCKDGPDQGKDAQKANVQRNPVVLVVCKGGPDQGKGGEHVVVSYNQGFGVVFVEGTLYLYRHGTSKTFNNV